MCIFICRPADEHFGDLFIDKLVMIAFTILVAVSLIFDSPQYSMVDQHSEYVKRFPKIVDALLSFYHVEGSPLVYVSTNPWFK